MNHLTEQELILHGCGEIDRADQARVEDHLTGCADCQAAVAQLDGLLRLVETAPPPEPGPGFERDVWARLEPQLHSATAGWRTWLAPPRWAIAGGVTALLILAFVAGRFSGDLTAPAPGAASQAAVSSARVLQAAVGDHLDRSQMMLVELVNTEGDSEAAAITEQSRAADLVSANRLFRQSAEQSGDAAIADLLDDLERVLLEVANAPGDVTTGERADLKSRIQAEDLLFRVRVIASEMRRPTGRAGDADDRGPRPPSMF